MTTVTYLFGDCNKCPIRVHDVTCLQYALSVPRTSRASGELPYWVT